MLLGCDYRINFLQLLFVPFTHRSLVELLPQTFKLPFHFKLPLFVILWFFDQVLEVRLETVIFLFVIGCLGGVSCFIICLIIFLYLRNDFAKIIRSFGWIFSILFWSARLSRADIDTREPIIFWILQFKVKRRLVNCETSFVDFRLGLILPSESFPEDLVHRLTVHFNVGECAVQLVVGPPSHFYLQISYHLLGLWPLLQFKKWNCLALPWENRV